GDRAAGPGAPARRDRQPSCRIRIRSAGRRPAPGAAPAHLSAIRRMSVLTRSGNWVRELAGWRRAGFAFAAGAVSALGFAPVEFFPALRLGFAALMLLLDGADEARHPMGAAFLSGWAFAFGQYLIGWHW